MILQIGTYRDVGRSSPWSPLSILEDDYIDRMDNGEAVLTLLKLMSEGPAALMGS